MIDSGGEGETSSDGTRHGAAEENVRVSLTITREPKNMPKCHATKRSNHDVDRVPRQVTVPV